MNRWRLAAVAGFIGIVLTMSPAHSAVTITIGESWDGPDHTLQKLVDQRYGAGRIDVTRDYLGAHAGDPDPWYWLDVRCPMLLVSEVAGNASSNVLGWYTERGDRQTFAPPALVHDGLHDGVIFDGPARAGATTVMTFPQRTSFGLYLAPNGGASGDGTPGEAFYTNRFLNDRGPNGVALHAPMDGDVQALVFDVSLIVGQPNVWLVCFEDLDAGMAPGPCCSGTDDDYNDLVVEVRALGVTPAQTLSLGALKTRYRR